jgi:hypothetical protein
MEEKIILDMLTQNSVSVKKQQYTIINGVEYLIGNTNSQSYINSINGRSQVETEVSEPYKSAIFAMWGSNPTIIEEPDIPTP